MAAVIIGLYDFLFVFGSRSFKNALFYDVDVVTWLILIVHCLIDSILFFSEKVSHLKNLILSPLIKYRQVFQKIDFLVLLSILNFRKTLLKIMSVKHRHIAVLECHNSRRPGRILQQGHLAKTAASSQPAAVNEPLLLHILKVALRYLLALLLFLLVHCQFHDDFVDKRVVLGFIQMVELFNL